MDCMHGIGSHGPTTYGSANHTTTASGGGAAAVGGASGEAALASAPALGAILLQLTRAVEALVQILGGAGALTQAPLTFAGANAAPVTRGGGAAAAPADRATPRKRTPAPAAAAAPAPTPAPAPPAEPTPPADTGGLSDAERTRMTQERTRLNDEARRLRDLLERNGGRIGTETAVNRLQAIERRVGEINERLG